jgi:Mor family transcriptional regulator
LNFKIVSESDKENIVTDYKNGMSLVKIGYKYNMSYNRIMRNLKEWNIEIKDKRITEEIFNNIMIDFESGMLMKDVEKKYNFNNVSIYKYMNKTNRIIHNEHGRKNFFNKSYFRNIDNEHKAYWLGFLMADSSICKVSKIDKFCNRLRINISYSDRFLLEQFAKDIEYIDYKIEDYIPKGTYSTNMMSKITINSIEMCTDLINNKCFEGKINRTIFPLEVIPDNLIRHFIRGYFDGDGSISCEVFSIIGNKDFLDDLQNILMINCNLNKTKLTKEKSINVELYYIFYGGYLQIQRIKDFLYKDATIYLERKHIKFDRNILIKSV